jgi:hypothetical protein
MRHACIITSMYRQARVVAGLSPLRWPLIDDAV